MSNKKRTFTVAFKTKIVLEALKEDQTMAQLSSKYDVSSKNIQNWKALFLSNAEIAMDPSKSVSSYQQANHDLEEKIDQYAKKVGELTIEKEFLVGKLQSSELSSRKKMINSEHQLSVTKQSILTHEIGTEKTRMLFLK
jgi:putative transposase